MLWLDGLLRVDLVFVAVVIGVERRGLFVVPFLLDPRLTLSPRRPS